MSLPQVSFNQPEGSSGSSRPVPEECVATVVEKDSDDMHPIASFMPSASVDGNALHDLMSARAWGSHIIWRAGVSAVTIPRARTHVPEGALVFNSRS